MTFTKHDADKLRFDLITPEFLEGLARNLTVGAKIYSDRNWEQGAEWSRYIASTLRHWNKWIAGEEFDKDGFHHLDAVAFGVMVLRTFFARGVGVDDRPTSVKRRQQPAPMQILNKVLSDYGNQPVGTHTTTTDWQKYLHSNGLYQQHPATSGLAQSVKDPQQ